MEFLDARRLTGPSLIFDGPGAGGVSMAFSAPIDALYAASELNEWAWAASAHELGVDVELPDFDETATTLRASVAEEANPELMRLIKDAAAHDKTLLWDDDEVSIGLGSGSKTWAVREIPDELEWDQHHDVPVGLVTGTNGKTTTVRLATHIARAAGKNVGLSSTDWIAVNTRCFARAGSGRRCSGVGARWFATTRPRR